MQIISYLVNISSFIKSQIIKLCMQVQFPFKDQKMIAIIYYSPRMFYVNMEHYLLDYQKINF